MLPSAVFGGQQRSLDILRLVEDSVPLPDQGDINRTQVGTLDFYLLPSGSRQCSHLPPQWYQKRPKGEPGLYTPAQK